MEDFIQRTALIDEDEQIIWENNIDFVKYIESKMIASVTFWALVVISLILFFPIAICIVISWCLYLRYSYETRNHYIITNKHIYAIEHKNDTAIKLSFNEKFNIYLEKFSLNARSANIAFYPKNDILTFEEANKYSYITDFILKDIYDYEKVAEIISSYKNNGFYIEKDTSDSSILNEDEKEIIEEKFEKAIKENTVIENSSIEATSAIDYQEAIHAYKKEQSITFNSYMNKTPLTIPETMNEIEQLREEMIVFEEAKEEPKEKIKDKKPKSNKNKDLFNDEYDSKNDL